MFYLFTYLLSYNKFIADSSDVLFYEKFELMLTRCAEAYSSSGSVV